MVPKLRFEGFNKNWAVKKLDNVFSFKNGLNASKEMYGKGVKFINVLDIINNEKITFDVIKESVVATDDQISSYQVRQGDILFQRSSETRDEVGQANVYADVKTVLFGGFVIRARPLVNINSTFLNFQLKTDALRKDITQRSGGSTRYNIGQDSLGKVTAFFPEIKEQEKIANFLSSVDEKITLLNKQYELLCMYKKGMIQKIFSQKLRFKDENRKEFPKWETCELKKFLIPTLREVKKPSENFLSVGIRSHFKGTFHKNDQDPNKVSVDKLFLVHEGDFILNITFAWEGALAIARKEDHLGYVSHRFPTYTFKKEVITPKFFSYIYTLPKFLTYLDLCSPGGAGRNRVLKKSEFIEIEIDKPCMAEQIKIANFLSALDDKIDVKKAELDKLKTWKQGLLQQMFV
ncbi:restriction endonuclease subunit S [Yersinia mollaretii]|uniref:Restriction endonuclease subunit S n=1 Tax=Yersinia mollaretii TaxID=33060 RepID=A0AA44CKH5_YERMO|nr:MULTISPECIES: restriction endonuclease subunit S [Enterobacterales]EKN6004665.1 restriction endonuclease subunit S [Yersinia enterocolitica]EKU2865061.1 restriction endonuclease subunit S [Raoultella ornithinolytica]MCE9871145.1 restriction endonuclease subunit S [Hafnia alvei]MDN0118815.1 restriction endonuclease subunit S [Yersinia frederiksenii]NIL22507.1 restriction endonuclease subunit S [Yersinia mollaretii]